MRTSPFMHRLSIVIANNAGEYALLQEDTATGQWHNVYAFTSTATATIHTWLQTQNASRNNLMFTFDGTWNGAHIVPDAATFHWAMPGLNGRRNLATCSPPAFKSCVSPIYVPPLDCVDTGLPLMYRCISENLPCEATIYTAIAPLLFYCETQRFILEVSFCTEGKPGADAVCDYAYAVNATAASGGMGFNTEDFGRQINRYDSIRGDTSIGAAPSSAGSVSSAVAFVAILFLSLV